MELCMRKERSVYWSKNVHRKHRPSFICRVHKKSNETKTKKTEKSSCTSGNPIRIRRTSILQYTRAFLLNEIFFFLPFQWLCSRPTYEKLDRREKRLWKTSVTRENAPTHAFQTLEENLCLESVSEKWRKANLLKSILAIFPQTQHYSKPTYTEAIISSLNQRYFRILSAL